MTGRDAILVAGRLTCPRCLAASYPDEAQWVDDVSVIVYYPSPCEHIVDNVRLVAPSALEVDRRCQATASTGTRCSMLVVTGGWCRVHASLPSPDERS